MRLLALALGVLALFAPAQAQECELTDGVMTHLLSVLRAQANMQTNVMAKIQMLNGVYGGGVIGSTLGMTVDSTYAAVLGDQANAWDDGVLTPEEIAADPEAAALALAFQAQIAEQFGLTPDQIDITGIGAPPADQGSTGGRRMLTEEVELTIAYNAPHTGKYL